MKLKTICNPAFWGACGLGLSLLATPAQALTLQQDDICKSGPALTQDNQKQPWLNVRAFTADQLPLTFDLHFDLHLTGNLAGYDQTTCDSVTRRIYQLGADMYKAAILRVNYEDLPENAPSFPPEILKELNNYLRQMAPAGSSARIAALDIRNVNAPGLPPEQARAMLAKAITYDYPAAPDPAQGHAQSYDGKMIAYRLTPVFDKRPAAYYAMGPDDEGIRRQVLTAVHGYVDKQIARRNASCVADDLPYIIAKAFIDATADKTLSHYVMLKDIKIGNLAITQEQQQKNNAPAKADAPVCNSELERTIGPYVR